VSQSRLLETALRHFRGQRMRLFERTFQLTARTRVLDVGGSPGIWQFASVQPRLTMLNLPSAIEPAPEFIARVGGDGCTLPFKDKAFDIVFSNSVIEHLGAQSQRERFAREIARAGRYYWVQTPDRRFPVEMHLMLPFVHYLPKRWQRTIAGRFTIWQLLAHPSPAQRRYYVEHFLDELHLLDAGELQALFPDSRIVRERLLGLTKSLIAVRA
jgi:hypothetical protein